jgi:predicted DCC family thiol-disulfide oxidoreductase YuxK
MKEVAAVLMAGTSDIAPPVLFFDGGCALCHGAIRRLLHWEREPHAGLRFAPLDGPTADTLRQRGQLPDHREAVILWTGEGEAAEGETAVGHALDIIGRPGRARTFRLLPATLRRAGYRLTARNRHRWFGRVPDDCPLPAHPARMLP